MPAYNSTLEARFEKHIFPCPMTGCWLWTGHLLTGGYGQISLFGRRGESMIAAHRASWMIHKGDIPLGMWVLHHCDVRCCVNPNHLFIGTRRDNVDDMLKKKRQAMHERSGMAKLTKDAALEIRSSTLTRTELANKFGVNKASIENVIHKRTWKL